MTVEILMMIFTYYHKWDLVYNYRVTIMHILKWPLRTAVELLRGWGKVGESLGFPGKYAYARTGKPRARGLLVDCTASVHVHKYWLWLNYYHSNEGNNASYSPSHHTTRSPYLSLNKELLALLGSWAGGREMISIKQKLLFRALITSRSLINDNCSSLLLLRVLCSQTGSRKCMFSSLFPPGASEQMPDWRRHVFPSSFPHFCPNPSFPGRISARLQGSFKPTLLMMT